MANRRRGKRRGRRARHGFAAWTPWKKALTIIGGVFILLVVTGVGLAAGYVVNKYNKIETTQLDAKKLNISEEIGHDETGYLNVALFGLDSRDNTLGSGERSDTMIIASLNRSTKEVKLCSVYRDTLLQQDDSSYDKANAAYAYGGAEEAISLLNKNLDMDIQHYVTVNFNALADVIDLLGGIDVDVTPEEGYWVNGYITETSKVVGRDTPLLDHAGLQTLTGIQAVSYARIRYTDGNDMKRSERQRTVLEAIVEKAQKADLSTINKIIDKTFPEVATNFTMTEVLAYAKDAFDYKLTETTGFPFNTSFATLSGAGSVVVPDSLAADVTQLHQFLFGKDSYTPSSIVTDISGEIAGYVQNNSTTEYDQGDEEYSDYGGTGDYSGYTDSGDYSQTGGTGYTDTGQSGGTGYSDTDQSGSTGNTDSGQTSGGTVNSDETQSGGTGTDVSGDAAVQYSEDYTQ